MPRPRELPDRARVVVVGGGGADVDRLPPRPAGRARRRPARPRRAHERLDVPLGGSRRAAALVGLADADDDGQRRALPAPGRGDGHRSGMRAVRRHPPGLHARARAGARPPRGVGADLRAGAGADLAARGAGALPADADGVRAASYLPSDGYLDPSQLTYALADGARSGGVRIFTHTRVTGIGVR